MIFPGAKLTNYASAETDDYRSKDKRIVELEREREMLMTQLVADAAAALKEGHEKAGGPWVKNGRRAKDPLQATIVNGGCHGHYSERRRAAINSGPLLPISFEIAWLDEACNVSFQPRKFKTFL